jgi:hypothetical protein
VWYNKIKRGGNMTKTEFLELCESKNISTNLIHFENSVADGYYVLKNYHRWEVFYRERGKDYNCIGFPSESDALIYLADKLMRT